MTVPEGYTRIAKGKRSDSLTHWGIGNPFKESSVKRDGKGQFSTIKGKVGSLLDAAWDPKMIGFELVGNTGYATFENGDGANKSSREFKVTQKADFDPEDVNGKLNVINNTKDKNGNFVREVEEHHGDGRITTTRFVMTKSKNLGKRNTKEDFLSEKEEKELKKRMPRIDKWEKTTVKSTYSSRAKKASSASLLDGFRRIADQNMRMKHIENQRRSNGRKGYYTREELDYVKSGRVSPTL